MKNPNRTALAILAVLAGQACAPRSELEQERLRVFQLSAFQQLDVLERRADELWPVAPERFAEYEVWLAEAEAIVAGLPAHRAQLARLAAGRTVSTAPAADPDGAPAFASIEDAWWHAQLVELVQRIEAFDDPDTGLIQGTAPPHGWGVRRRLDFVPRAGLVALGPDPATGLPEFADPQTGTIPARDPAGYLLPTDDTGLVFVLVPGGTFVMGAQNELGTEPNYDPAADRVYESPPHEVTLDPFLVSKYEMTQGQWERFTGANPSEYFSGRTTWTSAPPRPIGLRHPVESVTWHEVQATLQRLGFALPTEAQWEYAARAGMDTPWILGGAKEHLEGTANIADKSAATLGIYEHAELWLQDGYVYHAPVGLYAANAFGLHDVLGNVWEWCRDWVGPYGVDGGENAIAPGDGERLSAPDGHSLKVFRGGSFQDSAEGVRLSRRATWYPKVASGVLGLRPVCSVQSVEVGAR